MSTLAPAHPPQPAAHEEHGAYRGLMRWVTTTNHKDIGTMYLWFSGVMFFVGGVMALAIRAELYAPGLQVRARVFGRELDGLRIQHLRAGLGHLLCFFVRQCADASRIRHHPRIGGQGGDQFLHSRIQPVPGLALQLHLEAGHHHVTAADAARAGHRKCMLRVRRGRGDTGRATALHAEATGLATEMGLDVVLARRMGLLHDVGKAIDPADHVAAALTLERLSSADAGDGSDCAIHRASDVCLQAGQFSVTQTTSFLTDSAVHAAKTRFPHLRVIMEMGWLMRRAQAVVVESEGCLSGPGPHAELGRADEVTRVARSGAGAKSPALPVTPPSVRAMGKPNHAKRSRPRPQPVRRRRALQLRAAEDRVRRELERWRRR